jgi:serine/threonine protein kinase
MNLEGYNFIERISNNAFSETWQANKHNSEQTLSIIVINRSIIDRDNYTAIIQNANKVKELQYSNLVNLYDIIEQKEQTFFICESVTGKTILETVKKSGPLPEKTALTISLSVAGMLEAAHRKQHLSHGQISPSSIIINKDGAIKLAGLGMPSEKNERNFFTAPEHTPDKPGNALADMYSLGTTLYFMLTAKQSFNEAEDSHSEAHSISDKSVDLITKFTRTNPKERYATWQNAITDIEQAAAILPNTASLPTITGINNAVVDSGQPEQEKITASKNKNITKIPLWFRATAWLVLLAFLGGFAYIQLTNPIVDRNKIFNPQKNETAATATVPTPIQMEPDIPQQNIAEISEDIKKQTAIAILNNDITAAKQIIEQAATPATKTQTDKLLTLINSISDPDIYIANIFRDNIRKETIIIFGNTERKIIPIAVADANITAKLITDSDSRNAAEPVTFNIKELPIKEKLRLLEQQNDDAASIIKMLLNIKAGNINNARYAASSCGELTNAFTEQLKNKF